MTNDTSYTRGVQIYNNDKLMKFGVGESENGLRTITAQVKGSGRNTYEVEIGYDEFGEEVEESYCSCPAFFSYPGLCKHCVAVLLEYAAHELRQQTIYDYLEKKTEDRHSKLKTQAGNVRSEAAAFRTTPVMKELLSKRFAGKALPILHNEVYGNVRLEPYVECSRESISVEFKIGISQMYVLKDVFEFMRHMEAGAEYSYGKKLQFFHMEEAFHEASLPFVKFIANWVKDNGRGYIQPSYYGSYGYTTSRLRAIPLTGGDLEEFLEACGDRSFIMNVNYNGERSWKVTEAHLPRQMQIIGKKEGIQLKITPVFGFDCSKYYIYFVDGLIYMEEKTRLAPIGDFISCMAALPERTAYIQREDVPEFCRELLPVLEAFYECTKEGFNEEEYGMESASFEIYLDAPQKDFITCKLLAVYQDKKYNVYDRQTENQGREFIRELEVSKLVSAYFNAFDEKEHVMALADDEEKLYELLVYGIPKLQELGEVFVSDALKRMKVMPSPKVTVGISLSGNLLELDMSVEDMPMDQLVEILSKYDQKKKYFRLKNGSFVDIEGDSLSALLELKEGLHLSDSQLKKQNITVPKYRALYLDAELRQWQALPVSKDKGFKELVRNMKTVEDNDFEIPASLDSIMREYQKRGFLWLKTLKHNGFGGILADDMGLGKTLQVIAFLLSEYLDAKGDENKRCLVVAPASLVFNWNSELEKFAPALPVKMAIGTAAERKEIVENSGIRDILLTSYDLLKRDLEVYEGIHFYCQVIDEAQYIKNHNTQAAKAVKEVKSDFRVALTGTPVENRLSELWSIFDYLMPGFLYAYQRFREEIELPVVQNQEEKAMERLRKMIKPFLLRRLKKDVLTDLPDKLEENVYAKLEGEQQKLYDAHVKRMKLMLDKETDEEFKTSKIQILAELTKLRQICCDPSLLYDNYKENSAKSEMCMDLIENAISGGHKILLFSQFTSMLENLQICMREKQISFYTLTGATSKEKRSRLVEAFNKDDTSVFCISLRAGGTGLNLTSADIVIHYDPWWNLAVQNQATDRAHRIGQKNVVSVYKLIVKGTIEDNILKLQDKKKELADQVLNGEGMSSGSFTKDELLELLN